MRLNLRIFEKINKFPFEFMGECSADIPVDSDEGNLEVPDVDSADEITTPSPNKRRKSTRHKRIPNKDVVLKELNVEIKRVQIRLFTFLFHFMS